MNISELLKACGNGKDGVWLEDNSDGVWIAGRKDNQKLDRLGRGSTPEEALQNLLKLL